MKFYLYDVTNVNFYTESTKMIVKVEGNKVVESFDLSQYSLNENRDNLSYEACSFPTLNAGQDFNQARKQIFDDTTTSASVEKEISEKEWNAGKSEFMHNQIRINRIIDGHALRKERESAKGTDVDMLKHKERILKKAKPRLDGKKLEQPKNPQYMESEAPFIASSNSIAEHEKEEGLPQSETQFLSERQEDDLRRATLYKNMLNKKVR